MVKLALCGIFAVFLTALTPIFALTQLNESNFKQAISKGMVVVDFYADWCPACKHLDPTFDRIEKDMQGVTFAKINVDDAPTVKKEQNVRPLPTVIIYKDGREVSRRSGSADEKTLKAFINSAK